MPKHGFAKVQAIGIISQRIRLSLLETSSSNAERALD
jgi:hypothetical protein